MLFDIFDHAPELSRRQAPFEGVPHPRRRPVVPTENAIRHRWRANRC
jgi:hypothetical protein